MNRLNFAHLFTFYTVATEGSIKRATAKLHLSQPTISNQIRALEESLGYKLFDRKHRRLLLRDEGYGLLERIEKLFVLADEIHRQATAGRGGDRETIRVGVMPSLPNDFVYDVTLKLWQDPNIEVAIETNQLERLCQLLDTDELDFLLTDVPLDTRGRRYRSYNLGQQSIVVVAAPRFGNLKQGFPKSLDGQPYIGFRSHYQIQDEIDYFLKIHNIRPDQVGTVDDATLMRLVAEAGRGVAFLPALTVKRSLASGRLLALGAVPGISANRWLVTTQIGSQQIPLRTMLSHYLKRQSGEA